MNFEKIWRKYSCRQFINDEETGERIMYKNGFNKVIEESFPHERVVMQKIAECREKIESLLYRSFPMRDREDGECWDDIMNEKEEVSKRTTTKIFEIISSNFSE